MGGLGFAAMLWFLWALYRNAARKLKHWSDDNNGAIALAAMLGVTGILIHSFVDFNLQIPANAALFYVFCVLAAMESRFGKVRRRPVHRHDLIEEIPSFDAIAEDARAGNVRAEDARAGEREEKTRGQLNAR